MAIVLKYAAPGPILLAGTAAGRGHRENEDRDDALKLWQQQQQQNFQSRQQSQQQSFVGAQAALDREFRSELQDEAYQQADIDRQFRAGQQKTAQDFQAGQLKTGIEARGEEQRRRDEFMAKSRAEEQRRRDEFIADQNTLTGLRRGELVLPQAAQRRLQQLDAGLVDAMKLSPAEQDEFRQKYEAEKRSLLRLATPTRNMPYDDMVRKNLGTNYEQYKNLPWQFNEQGEMSLPTGFKLPGNDQAESEQKFNESVMKRYEKNLTELDEDTGGPKYSDENKALQAAIDSQNTIERGRQRLLARGQAPAAAKQPAGEDATWSARAAEGARAQSQAQAAVAGRPLPDGRDEMDPRNAITRAKPGDIRHDDYVRGPNGEWGSTTPSGGFVPAKKGGLVLEGGDRAQQPQAVKPASQLTPAQQPAQSAGVTMNDLPDQRRKVVSGMLPHPKSPEEAKRLPPGSWFIAPDGRMLRTPAAAP